MSSGASETGSATRLTVGRLGRHGDGIADAADGPPVHITRALPGELVEGALEDGRIAAPRILTPSPDRVRPPCPHYGGCGGCALLHVSEPAVADWKLSVVRDALAAAGFATTLRPIATSPPRSRRRAALSGRRTKSGAVVGFHGRRSETLVAVPDCLVLTDRLRAVLPALERIVRLGASRKGEISFAVFAAPAGVDVSASGGKPADPALQAELAQLAGAAGIARLTWNGEILAQSAAPQLRFGTAPVTPPPGAFLQATQAGEDALRAAVEEATGPAARRVADLFAGCGTFALPLAARCAVHAVENDAAALEALLAGWRGAGGLHRLSVERRDLFKQPLTADELDGLDAVVVDPPRAGAAAQMAELARSAVPRIAAVSCNPASFARDAAVLAAGGYRLDWVQVVDQFRWSPHIELAAAFHRL